MTAVHNISATWQTEVKRKAWGTIPTADNSTISSDLVAWQGVKSLMEKSVTAGSTFSSTIVSTYQLTADTNFDNFFGGVLSPNGDIYLVPEYNPTSKGFKINSSGIMTTYSLLYGIAQVETYLGGVLAANGDIHFVPGTADRGQKVSQSGVVSTYTLIYTTTNTSGAVNCGGVLSPNGDVLFAPASGTIAQKVSATGVVSTYTIIGGGSWAGGVLDPYGNMHLVPRAFFGQKISPEGVCSTYTIRAGSYSGGVLSPNGDIHFVPENPSSTKGQKVSMSGVASTYSLRNTNCFYKGGVLAPNGDIHFVPDGLGITKPIGQKVSITGVVSTYTTGAPSNQRYIGAILLPNGDIHFLPKAGNPAVGCKISTLSAIPFDNALCLSPYLNKY